jgi:hypothetical protein
MQKPQQNDAARTSVMGGQRNQVIRLLQHLRSCKRMGSC